MEKIIHYDLIEKINTANGIIDYKKTILENLRDTIIAFGSIGSICSLVDNTDVENNIKILFQVCVYFFGYSSALFIFLDCSNKAINMDNAYKELSKLAAELTKSDINISFDLLLKSKLLAKETILPKLTQNKYILMPTYTGIGDTTKDIYILQEHKFGSDDYILSIGSPPVKSYKPIPVYR